MIRAEKICKTYKSNSKSIHALDHVDIQINDGEKVAIVGRSGSGKTTLLNLLSGLDRPTSGRLLVDGKELAQLGSVAMASYRLDSVGVIFQSFQLIPQRTAAQNVELPLIIAGHQSAIRNTMVDEALKKVGLENRANHFPYQLSGGEQQRVAIARAIVNKPAVVLADEPTGNLDSNTANDIMNLLMQVCRNESLTLVLVTHDLNLADKSAERQFTMHDGKLTDARKDDVRLDEAIS